jgi:sterol desaturase/sphingolipid hydroxylase (fatty acid hydroxylase superfamily)
MIILFILGLILWTLVEYILHRFAGHELKGQNPFKKELFKHHKNNNYFASVLKMGGLSILVSLMMFALFSTVLSVPYALVSSFGFTSGYLYYEFIHKGIHLNYKFIPTKLIDHHMSHHQKMPLKNYSVTTKLWDKVFKSEVKFN